MKKKSLDKPKRAVNKYSEDEIDWIRKYYYNHTREDTVKKFNEKFDKVITLGGLASIIFTRRLEHIDIRCWTKEQDEWLKENANIGKRKDIANKFNKLFNENKTLNSIYCRCRTLKITKEVVNYTQEEYEWLKSNYRDDETFNQLAVRFQERFNKRIRGQYISDYFQKQKIKKKSLSHAIKGYELGQETIHQGKSSRLRVLIKVDDKKNAGTKNYVRKQRFVWEQHYGEIPKDYCIIFKDNNPLNFDINNLECVSKKTNLILNKHDLKNKGEITNTMIMLEKLMDLNEKERNAI